MRQLPRAAGVGPDAEEATLLVRNASAFEILLATGQSEQLTASSFVIRDGGVGLLLRTVIAIVRAGNVLCDAHNTD